MNRLLDDSRIMPAADEGELHQQQTHRAAVEGKAHESTEIYASLVQNCPDDERLRTAYGIALAAAGQTPAALKQFQKAAELVDDAPQHRNLGVALMELGRIAEATAGFRRAIQLDPQYADGHRLLSEALRLQSEGETEANALSRQAESMEALQRWVGLNASQPDVLIQYATALQARGRLAEAVLFLEQACRMLEPRAELLRELGIARLLAGDHSGAANDLQATLRLTPSDVETHIHLAIARDRQGDSDAALAQLEQAVLLHQSAPGRWQPRLDAEAAKLSLRLEAEQGNAATPLELPAGDNAKLLTILVGCYGDFPAYSVRCLESLSANGATPIHCELFIGLNQCGEATAAKARQFASDGIASLVIDSRHNLNKDPMMRLMLEQVRTPYVMWLDDDSHFVDPDWAKPLIDWVRQEHPFDVAGQLARWGPNRFADPVYARFIKARPWWRSEEHLPIDLQKWAPFVVGGMFVARTSYLLSHGFPDRGMTKALDDVALGEMVLQKGGRLVGMPPRLLSRVRISDGDRRGENYHLPGHPRSM